jgi:hypothetical protein
MENRVDAQAGAAVVSRPSQIGALGVAGGLSATEGSGAAKLPPTRTGSLCSDLYDPCPRGFSTIVASGGRETLIEAGRPWLEKSSAITPGPFPRLLPP